MRKEFHIFTSSVVILFIVRIIINNFFKDAFADGNFLILVIVPLLIIMSSMYLISYLLKS